MWLFKTLILCLFVCPARVAAVCQQCQDAGRNAANESQPDERGTWIIISTIDWSDLIPAASGYEIKDTARRAISLEQLLRLQAHAVRRLQAGEQWDVWRPDDPHHLITSIDEVVAATQCVSVYL